MGRVLIVDRKDESTPKVGEELTRREHDCTTIDDVGAAVRLLSEFDFDVVILVAGPTDTKLRSVIRKLSKLHGRALIVLATGHELEDGRWIRRHGGEVVGLGDHPVSALADQVEEVMQRSNAQVSGTEVELARALAVIRTQLAISGEGVIVCDTNDKIIHYNQAFLDMWGIPERLVRNGDARSVLIECFETTNAGTVSVEIVFGDPDIEVSGKRLELVSGWVLQWSTHPVRLEDGSVIGRTFGFRDLTPQIAAEEQVRFHANLLEEVPSAIIAATASGHVRYWNRTAEHLHGWTNAEVTGRDVRELLFPEAHRERGVEALAGLRERGRWHGELQLRRKDDSTFPALLTLIQIAGVRGQPSLVVGVIMDLTERRALEARLLQAQKMEAVGTLAGGLAHDFNNLLTGVLGSAGLAREMPDLDPGAAELMEMIERAALRGRDLCSQLLSFSRAERPNVAAINTLETIAEVAKIVERTFPKEVRLRIEADDDLPPLLADRSQINQALMNLLVNARDAMPDGGNVIIRATTSTGIPADLLSPDLTDDRLYVRLEVSDTGEGMSSEVVSRMFEPFFTTKRSGKGTGLGLAMVFSQVQAHGGEIRVWSALGEGSTFALFLPSADGRFVLSQRKARASAELESFAGSERILLVDDEAMVRNVGARILKQFGYDTVEAASGHEALEILDREGDTIGAILLDMIMPEMEGSEVFHRLRERGVTTPVLLCSAFKVAGTVDALIEQGAVGFVQKPYRLQELLPTLRATLDGRPLTIND